MAKQLEDTTVAVLVADGFEQVEMTSPIEALREAGATVQIVSPNSEQVQGWNHNKWADHFNVDVPIEDANEADFDALLLPGGVMNPDKLRMDERAVSFVESFFGDRKPVAAICHGPWTLVEADVVEGRRMTSWPSLQTDLRNAGANWVDEQVVIDDNLVTSRSPSDLKAFNDAMVERFAAGIVEAQEA